jgi:hypothetical protein
MIEEDTSSTVKTTVEKTSFSDRFAVFRRVIVFLLGMAVIIDALWDRSYVVPELIIGMILVGVLPIDEVIKSMTSRRRRGG